MNDQEWRDAAAAGDALAEAWTSTHESSGTQQCRVCMRRRPMELILSVGRSGGGTYRRGGRSYSSSICVPCASVTGRKPATHAMQSSNGFDVTSLRRALRMWCAVWGIERPDWLLPSGREVRS